ncbi:MAG: hypothetical protein WCQ23_00580 [Candidatus Methanomethylophilaceae archaeon]
MSRTDILSEIKGAEAKADAMVVKAEADKKDAIAEARRDSVKRIQDAEAAMRSSYESAMTKEKEELDVMRSEKLAVGEKEADKIESSSNSQMQEVKDFLEKKFEENINVTS